MKSIKVFAIADTHFNHDNIIRYCNRPFQCTNDMNEEMIKRWNLVVKPNDIIIHLGDFGFGSKESLTEICQRLNGKKILIKGNHDIYKDNDYLNMGFYKVSEFPILYNNFYLCSHEPVIMSNTTPYYNLYGHIHNDDKYVDTPTSKCCCVEKTNYFPHYLFTKN